MSFPLKRALNIYNIARKTKGGLDTTLYRTNDYYMIENDSMRISLYYPIDGIKNGYNLTSYIKDLKNCKCEPTYSKQGLVAGDCTLKAKWLDDYEYADKLSFDCIDIDILELKRVCEKLQKHMYYDPYKLSISYLCLNSNEAMGVHPYHFGITKTDLDVKTYVLKEVAEVILDQVESDSTDGIIGIGEDCNVIAFDDIVIIYESMNGEYFSRFDELLSETGYKIKANAKNFAKAIENFKIPKKDARINTVKLYFTSNEKESTVIKLSVDGDKYEDKSAEIEFSCDEDTKEKIEGFTVHFNWIYLVEFLQGFDDDIVDLDFVGSLNPLIGRDRNNTFLVLPVRVKEQQKEDDEVETEKVEDEKKEVVKKEVVNDYAPMDLEEDDDLPF